MKVLVCGGRGFDDAKAVASALDDISTRHAPVCVLHGGCSGADALANSWAVSRNASVEAFPADWKEHGRAAGPIRNKRMLEIGAPDLVLAFPGGRGTANMVRLAEAAGVKVVRFYGEQE